MKDNFIMKAVAALAVSSSLVSLSSCTPRERADVEITGESISPDVITEKTATKTAEEITSETGEVITEPAEETVESYIIGDALIIGEEVFLPALLGYNPDDAEQRVTLEVLKEIYSLDDFSSVRCYVNKNEEIYKSNRNLETEFTSEQWLELKKLINGIKLEKFDGDRELIVRNYSGIDSVDFSVNSKINNDLSFCFMDYMGKPVVEIIYLDNGYKYHIDYFYGDYYPVAKKAMEFVVENNKAKPAETTESYYDPPYSDFYSSSPNDLYSRNPYGAGMISVTYRLRDTSLNAFVDFDVWLEKETNGKWEAVTPLGGKLIQENYGWDKMWNNAKTVWFDLSWYPDLPEGRYRLTKPIYIDSSDGWSELKYGSREEHKAYLEKNCRTDYMYYEFDLTKTGKYDPLPVGIRLESDSFPVGVDSIDVLPVPNDGIYYSATNSLDVQYNDNGVWKSVRKTPVVGNVNVGYGIGTRAVNSSDFDLSRKGEYRVRMCVSIIDSLTSSKIMSDHFETWYVNFTLD